VHVYLSQRSHQRIMQRIRELTPRTWGNSLEACIAQADQYLRGWEAYFDLCTRPAASRWPHYDAHLRRRLRMIVIHQRKRPPVSLPTPETARRIEGNGCRHSVESPRHLGQE